jgi:glyoxylase-like metal-dependent hydrolase (beta-lactamase superfamily II)
MVVKKIKEGIFQFSFGNYGSCVYLLNVKGSLVLIDVSSEENKEELIDDLKEVGISVEDIDIVLLTHRHWDHEGNLELFEKAKIFDAENISRLNLEEFEVFKVPGHTKDSLAFLYNRVLFSGDTLFENGIGRVDFEESEPSRMDESLELLRGLDYGVLAPGHV